MQRSSETKLQEAYGIPALALMNLTPEQAKKFLLHHANLGDQGAKEILKLVLPTGNDSK